MAEPPAHPYRVVYPGRVRQFLQECARKANEHGVLPSFLEALKVIDERLTSVPLAWGEKSHHLYYANLAVADGFHARIHVHFAVDDERRIVYVIECRLLSGHPFGE